MDTSSVSLLVLGEVVHFSSGSALYAAGAAALDGLHIGITADRGLTSVL